MRGWGTKIQRISFFAWLVRISLTGNISKCAWCILCAESSCTVSNVKAEVKYIRFFLVLYSFFFLVSIQFADGAGIICVLTKICFFIIFSIIYFLIYMWSIAWVVSFVAGSLWFVFTIFFCLQVFLWYIDRCFFNNSSMLVVSYSLIHRCIHFSIIFLFPVHAICCWCSSSRLE